MTHSGQYVDLSDLDLRSNFDLDLSRSPCICFDASRREKHDGAKIIALPLLVKNISEKPFPPKTVILAFDDPWSKNILILAQI